MTKSHWDRTGVREPGVREAGDVAEDWPLVGRADELRRLEVNTDGSSRCSFKEQSFHF